MIRFGTIVSVVALALGLLVAGAVSGDLVLVYLAIGLASLALLMLIAGVVLWRDEIFGVPAGAHMRGDATEEVATALTGSGLIGAAAGPVTPPGGAGQRAADQPLRQDGHRTADPDAERLARGSRRPVRDRPYPPRPGRGYGEAREDRDHRDRPRPAARGDRDWHGPRPDRGPLDLGPQQDRGPQDRPLPGQAAAWGPPAGDWFRPVGDQADAAADARAAGADARAAGVTGDDSAAAGAEAGPSGGAGKMDGTGPRSAPAARVPAADSGAGAGPPSVAGAAGPASAAGAAGPASAAGAVAAPESADVTGERPGSAGSPAAAPERVPLVTVVPGIARYHRSDCILIRFLAPDDLQTVPVADAEGSGCVPCRACRPENEPAKA